MAHVMDPPPQPPPSQRPALTCERHPRDSFTGFCASCLRERLQTLETASSTSTTHRNSTSTISSSLKSIFLLKQPPPPDASELRRCKSFSFSAPRISTSFEPQRRSCDVRGRNTLWSLFNQDDSSKIADPSAAVSAGGGEIEEEGRDEITDVVDPPPAADPTSEEAKLMKEHRDLEAQTKKQSASTFWLAASVFSKKLQKWRRKQKMKKMKKHEDGKAAAGSKSSRRFHETQSEIAVDAFGRRSCDFAPRFSLDAGRFSFDDPRYSIDEPRASWDGFLIGNRPLHPRVPPMLSVVEDVVPADPVIQRSDGQIPVEEDLAVPGNSQQTKDYYSDSSSKSSRSLDRSSSVKKVSVEMNDNEFVRDWSSNSFRDDRSESFESAYREDSSHKLPPRKKSKRWSKAWSIWGFIHRRSTRAENAVERSFSEVWPNGYANGRILRSNSNVSSRSSTTMRKNGFENNGIGKKRRDGFVFERNRSARYSPGRIDNGMLRFYLTPMKGSRRGSSGMMGRHSSGYNSFTRSVLGLY